MLIHQVYLSILRAKVTPDVAETDSGSCDCRKIRIQKHRLSQNHQPRVKNFDRITARLTAVEITVASRRAGDRVCEWIGVISIISIIPV